MTRRALLSALGLWSSEPKAVLLANLLFAVLMTGVLGAAELLPRPWSWGAALALGCTLFLSLIRALRALDRSEGLSLWRATRGLGSSFLDGLPSIALAIAALLAAWAAAEGAPFGAGLVGLAAWLALGALLSLGLAAPEGQAWWAASWAGLLAVVGFLPIALTAAVIFSWLGGFWALWLGPDFRGAGFFWAPLLLAPFFTPSFCAAYLYYLAQGIKDRSQGRPPLEQAPTLKEILKPWR